MPSDASAAFKLRPLNEGSAAEIDLIVARTIDTVLETVPEFGGSQARAVALIPNLTHAQMREMYVRDFPKPTHNFLVAEANGVVIGHSIYFLRLPEGAAPFGYLFTRFVTPSWRRRGVGSGMLAHTLAWFREVGATLVSAHTHPTNTAERGLLESAGFGLVERLSAPWESLHYRLDLTASPDERRSAA
ncbi:GNAT family N-acetyltransferase [Bradyrhizobium sp. UFLA05-153]